MEAYDDLVRQARARVRAELVPLRSDLGGDEVQMSVRLPAGLRSAVAEVAAGRHRSLTAFVIETLERAVREAADPFAGLAAELAQQARAALAEALDSGAYAEAAAQVDAAEEDRAIG